MISVGINDLIIELLTIIIFKKQINIIIYLYLLHRLIKKSNLSFSYILFFKSSITINFLFPSSVLIQEFSVKSDINNSHALETIIRTSGSEV